MMRFRQLLPSAFCGGSIRFAAFAFGLATAAISAQNSASTDVETEGPRSSSKAAERMSGIALIACITPDGHFGVAGDKNLGAAALILADDTLSCSLPEGETTFIIALPVASLLDHFTFINENAAAEGVMSLAVSNDNLPPSSAKWLDVNGRVAFTRKRHFNFSLVGVEAKYVKLSFRVVKSGRIATLGL